MKNYIIEEKDSFIVLGIGIEIKSEYIDFVGINKEKEDFWLVVKEDGRLDILKVLVINEYIFFVSEVVNNKMMYYVGVMIEV